MTGIPHPTNCARCQTKLRAWTMSRFTTECICLQCEADEKLAPGYRAAYDAEFQACLSGDYNYRGIGLTTADRDFLHQRRQARAPHA